LLKYSQLHLLPGLVPINSEIKKKQPEGPGQPLKNIPKMVWGLVAVSALIIGIMFLVSDERQLEFGKIESAEVLRIGVLPDQSPKVLRKRFASVLSYLAENLQLNCELIVPESYSDLLGLFHDQKVDLVYLGGYSYVKVRQNDQAIPLVMRRVDTRFTSLFIVNANSPAQTLDNLENKSITFGSSLSTSGHLMPRYFLQQKNINPESFFSEVRYSGAHDRTAYWVRDGVVDVGAANATTIRSMLDKKLIAPNDFRVLWETPPYADYVWAIRPQFAESFRFKVRDAFLQLSPDNADHAIVLQNLNAIGYIPADPDYFVALQSIAREIETKLVSNNVD
jgi:phosphonate transport system substrate-binding protein